MIEEDLLKILPQLFKIGIYYILIRRAKNQYEKTETGYIPEYDLNIGDDVSHKQLLDLHEILAPFVSIEMTAISEGLIIRSEGKRDGST